MPPRRGRRARPPAGPRGAAVVRAIVRPSCPPPSSSSTTRRTSGAPSAWCWRGRASPSRRPRAARRRWRGCPTSAADVMLLDVQLPGISGLETLERIGGMGSRTGRAQADRHHDLGPRHAGRRRARREGGRVRPDREAARSRAADGGAAQRARAAGHGARGRGPARARRRALGDGGPQRAHAGPARADRQGRAHAHARAHHRRVGHRQGADRARHPPASRRSREQAASSR